MRDRRTEELAPFLPEALAFLDEAKSSGIKCLVYCLAGSSRSVSMVLAYLIMREGFSLHDAWVLVKSRRPVAQPNCSFAAQLIELDRSVHGSCASATLADFGFDEE
ncbi:unnamed protein product [Polarella glacialis]|uniref:Protein-serine/threonine phosphatase n=1 Tax=Polarella glacialis TaxID=89957 RepID=A0A813DC91_POLGL|nr:unnamed protein product [Polarella glacialis]CAE8605427.1 unnamed protein product [Polarella glacialis]CAE8665291.1 unnamed protein product [Polarella glacialis]